MDNVNEFIYRRFPTDNKWLSGNCYYFAVILKARFPDGTIWYDVIDGHFVFSLNEKYYDWRGQVFPLCEHLVEWDKFDQYDELQKQRIVSGCVI